MPPTPSLKSLLRRASPKDWTARLVEGRSTFTRDDCEMIAAAVNAAEPMLALLEAYEAWRDANRRFTQGTGSLDEVAATNEAMIAKAAAARKAVG